MVFVVSLVCFAGVESATPLSHTLSPSDVNSSVNSPAFSPEARALSHFSCVFFFFLSQPRLASSLVRCSKLTFSRNKYFSCPLKGSEAETGSLSLGCCWTAASCVLLRLGWRFLQQWAWALVCPLGCLLPFLCPLRQMSPVYSGDPLWNWGWTRCGPFLIYLKLPLTDN